jgi:uncharacterized membrane protein (DUF485 family)
MIPHAPADATFPSLLLGLFLGLAFSVGTYVGFTQEWRGTAVALGQFVRAWGIATWMLVGVLTTIYIRVGWMKLHIERKLKAEVR